MKHWKEWDIKEIDDFDKTEVGKRIPKCPKKIFYRGEWDELMFQRTLAIVGSRKMTRYGEEVLGMLLPELVTNRITIVSGFMYGIDSVAHKMTIDLGGKTVAVLGCGLNCLTPADNDRLYTEILESGGVVISEYEPNFKATIWSFPQRNRIVAGLANLGVLVVEAGLKSGSLITARIANDLARNVYAVPGSIFSSSSAGTNWLISEHMALATTEVADILPEVEVTKQQKLPLSSLSKDEAQILDLIRKGSISLDEISRLIGKSIVETTGIINIMTLKNLISEEAGLFYPCHR